MKQIEAFVNSVYQDVGGNKKEIQELKAEMKSHLLEAVHELKLEGKSEQKAIEIAIERFGGEKEMRSIVSQLFKAQKTFAKWVLYLAMGFLVVSLSFFGFLWQNEEKNANELSIVATQIGEKIQDKETITANVKNEIEKIINSSNHISTVSVYNTEDIKSEGKNFVMYDTDAKEADYTYKRVLSAPKWLGVDFYPYGNGDKQWYVEMDYRSFSTLETMVLFAGIAVYWTLFTIWGIVNAYHHKRLNVGWIIAFSLLNVIGYLVYFLVGKKKAIVN
ncbi:permease prefix domain 1-containing protein [Priestia aryabhattai]|uniref:permease prefix domain 1-containing protein n=1 Tax=Priestia aryabhattai TaxID=412384 RepID=UPI001C8D1DB1|nr:permease prefix domain 1-containing protein [Priestia aryabhattai]MBY0213876.1 hypothetical protein [Priestia aryabhattai]